MNEAAKQAQREYKRKWREKNNDKTNEYMRNWRKNNKEKVKEYTERYWMKKAAEQ